MEDTGTSTGTIRTKAWTIAITGAFDVGPVRRRAVVITDPGGGSVRLKSKGKLKWTNTSAELIHLKFEDWPEDGGEKPAPVWPFSDYNPSSGSVDTRKGLVILNAGMSFEGSVAGTGRIVIKYWVLVPDGSGNPVEDFVPLDPIIVVER